MKKRNVMLLGFCLLFLFISIARMYGVVLNTSNSLPGYLYISKQGDIKVGSEVKVCLKKSSIADIALSRHFIDKGFCPSGYGYILKTIKAAHGDMVNINHLGVTVNGLLLPNSLPLDKDKSGRKMPALNLSRSLGKDEFLLMTSNPNSFDSRYFGIVSQDEIVSLIVRVL